MKRRMNWITLVFCCILPLSMIGCGSNGCDYGSEEVAPAYSLESRDQVIASVTSRYEDSAGIPTHIKENFGKLNVDASVILAPDTSAAVFQSQLIEWTLEDILILFDIGKPFQIDVSEDSNDPYIYAQSDEGYLSILPGTLVGKKYECTKTYYDLPLLFCTGIDSLNETYPSGDIALQTLDNARFTAVGLLENLGLSVGRELSANALTASRMNETKTNNLAGSTSDVVVRLDQADIDREYSAEDERIILRYQLSCGDFFLTTTPYQDAKSGQFIAGTVAEIWVGPNGPTYVSIENACEFNGVTEEFQVLIQPYEALTIAADKYKSVLTENQIQVKDVKLEYVRRPTLIGSFNPECVLAWVISPGVDAEKYSPTFFVNATTGELL